MVLRTRKIKTRKWGGGGKLWIWIELKCWIRIRTYLIFNPDIWLWYVTVSHLLEEIVDYFLFVSICTFYNTKIPVHQFWRIRSIITWFGSDLWKNQIRFRIRIRPKAIKIPLTYNIPAVQKAAVFNTVVMKISSEVCFIVTGTVPVAKKPQVLKVFMWKNYFLWLVLSILRGSNPNPDP
jgi:hypothetical protein